MKGTLRLIFVMAFVVLFSMTVLAQRENGTITGTVTDPSGAVIANAKITATSVNTGATRTATSAGNGTYTIANLPPGPYDVRVEAPGFGPFTTRGVVSVGGVLPLDAKLQLQAAGTTVEVVGQGGVAVNTENQQLGDVVTSTQITQLPTLTRNPYDLVATSGNVAAGDQYNEPNRGVGVNINGQRSASTDILLDGGENVDLFTATVGQTVPLDSVQEFRVLTSDFTAQYGRASGGVVNVATKSGTNNFHGSLYEFNRISALAANTYENIAQMKDAIASGTCTSPSDRSCPGRKGVFNRNDFGGSLGGPIVKDKLFFFGNLEGLRVRSNGVQNLLVPTPEFIAAAAPETQAFFNAFGKLAHPINGRSLTVADLAGQSNAGPALSALPASTPILGVVNFAVPSDAGGGNPQNTWLAVGRVDLNLTEKTQLFGRYGLQKENDFPGVINFSPYTGFDTGQSILNNNAMFSLSHIFTNSIVSQTKLVYNRLNLQQPLGKAPVGPTLYMNPVTEQSIGGIAVAFPGYNELTPGNAIPFGGPQNLGQVFEDLTITKGSHTIGLGGQFVYTQDNRMFGAYEEAVEALASPGDIAGGLDAFLSGQLFQFQGAVDPQGKFPCVTDVAGHRIVTPQCTLTLPAGPPNFSRSNRYKDGAAYIQDSWKMFPRFTLNAGLRWEYYGVQHNKNPNLDSNFYLGPGANLPEQIRNGSVLTVPNSPIKNLWKPDWNNFAPRVGFAWDLFGDGRTSLRGGYGIAYERNFGNVTFNVIQNPPNYAVVSLVAGTDVPTIPITVDNSGLLAGTSGTKPLPRTSLRAIDQNLVTSYAHMWSMSLERELAAGTILTLAYSGSRGMHQYVIQNPNRPGAGVIYNGDDPTVNPLSRMNLQYTNINRRGSQGDSYYNGLNVGVRSSNFRKTGLQLSANYTWSHAIDELSTTFSESNNSFNLGLLDPFNAALDKGSADFDVRHRGVLSAVWTVPWWQNSDNRFLRNVLGGFELAPIFEARTGTPFTVYDCTNGNSVCPRWIPGGPVPTTVSSNPTPIGPNLFNILNLPNAKATAGNYVNPLTGTSDFGNCTTPGQGATGPCPWPAGMMRRNSFRGPSFWNFTLAGYKNFKMTERMGLQLRAEAFNIFNHHNFYVLGTTADVFQQGFVQAKKGGLGAASFPGAPTDERRNLQLGVKLTW